MRRGHITGGVLLALLCALALAGPATAAPHKRSQEPLYPPNGFELQGTNGFTVTGSFYRQSEGSTRGTFAVTATRGHEAAIYSAPARVTPTRIRADLGRLGRVDLTLHLAGGEGTTKLRCSKESIAYEPGTFQGVFEFRGEGGFTRAIATSVAGAPDFTLESPGLGLGNVGDGCGASSGEALTRNLPGARLKAVDFAAGRTLKFQLNKNRPTAKTLYAASLRERIGRIRIYRELSGTAPAGAFRFGRRLRTATVDPPAPFSGTARVTRRPNAVSPLLTGDLKLAFLGRTVKLAGHAVHVSFEHARQTRGENGRVGISF